MKKTSGFVLAAVAALLSFSAEAASVRRPKKEENLCGLEKTLSEFRIAGFSSYAPFSWKKVDQKASKGRKARYMYDGFVADSVTAALKDIGITHVTSKFYDSDEDLKNAVKRGEIDIVFATFYQGGDQAGMDYIYPAYFGNPLAIVSRADKKVEKSEISELKGMIGVARSEEGVYDLIKGQLPTDTKVVLVEGAESAFQKLLEGDADFMVTSPYAAMAESGRLGVADKIYIYPKALRPIKFFAAFSKMSKCRRFKEPFEKAFAKYFADKTEAEKKMHHYIKFWRENGTAVLEENAAERDDY